MFISKDEAQSFLKTFLELLCWAARKVFKYKETAHYFI